MKMHVPCRQTGEDLDFTGFVGSRTTSATGFCLGLSRVGLLNGVVAFVVLLLLLPRPSQADAVDFQRDIAPILEERCWYCHGEDEQESGLRLDLRATDAAWR